MEILQNSLLKKIDNRRQVRSINFCALFSGQNQVNYVDDPNEMKLEAKLKLSNWIARTSEFCSQSIWDRLSQNSELQRGKI